jgi:DNA-binding MarR family transcriptional regulator
MKAMEAQGYITRSQIPTNKKNVYVHLTDAGRALKEKLVPLAEETNKISVEGLAAKEVVAARKVLLAMLVNLAKDESTASDLPVARTNRKPMAKITAN